MANGNKPIVAWSHSGDHAEAMPPLPCPRGASGVVRVMLATGDAYWVRPSALMLAAVVESIWFWEIRIMNPGRLQLSQF